MYFTRYNSELSGLLLATSIYVSCKVNILKLLCQSEQFPSIIEYRQLSY